MNMPQRELFRNALLGLLCGSPAHGYRLAARFGVGGDLGDLARVGRSQVYALLQNLEAEGLATTRLEPGPGGPARRVFQVTERGRAHFLDWAVRPVDSIRGLRLEFLLKFHLLGLLGHGGQPELCRIQKTVLEERRMDLAARRDGAGPLAADRIELQLALLDAGLAWLATRAGDPG